MTAEVSVFHRKVSNAGLTEDMQARLLAFRDILSRIRHVGAHTGLENDGNDVVDLHTYHCPVYADDLTTARRQRANLRRQIVAKHIQTAMVSACSV